MSKENVLQKAEELKEALGKSSLCDFCGVLLANLDEADLSNEELIEISPLLEESFCRHFSLRVTSRIEANEPALKLN